jgi:hypothetical protein
MPTKETQDLLARLTELSKRAHELRDADRSRFDEAMSRLYEISGVDEYKAAGFYNSIPYEFYLCLRDREVFADEAELKRAMIEAEDQLFDYVIGPALDKVEDFLSENYGLQLRQS